MALNEQMQQMIQQDIKDAETRPKAEILQEQMEGLKTAGRTARDIAVESIPGVGEEIAARRVEEALKAGDKVGAGIEATAGLLGIVPGVGDALAQGVRKTKAPLRKLLDKLPQREIDDLPSQPDDVRIYGYHGTARERKPDEPFFDINFARKNDQFLGEGFYFTLDPEVASEYASIRGIKSERQIKGEQAKKILADENVIPSERGMKGSGTSVEVTPQGEYVTGGSMMKGQDIYGNPVSVGQYVGRFDLSNIEKPYVVRTEKQRKELKAKIPELKKQGYDAVLFADFKDRSKQIMVFPEHMDKIDTSAIAGRSATSTVKDAEPLQIGINPATKDGALLKKYDASTVNRITENSSAATAGTKEANKLINAKVADGEKVGIRLNLNSTIPNMPKGLDKLQTLHKNNYNGKALSYKSFATVEDVTFNVSQKGRQGIAARIKNIDVPEAKSKFPAMSVDGKYNNTRNVLDELDDDVVEIGFNPANGHLFVDMSTGQAVKSADVATVIGDRVYAKGVTYMKKAEAPNPIPASDGTSLPSEVRYKMKKGGAVPMNNMAKQMELFEPVERGFDEGGLMDEGGTVDPISGNDVPPGSTQEEVRDDIPAQLSEGEFVFPADVVRYIGLERLMMMRQEAKQGLAQMEAMGQMGNGDEAVMPDDLPFDMYDLEVENDGLEMQTGGMVPAPMSTAMGATTTGGSYNPATNQFQSFAGMGSTQPQPLGTAFTPPTAASAAYSPRLGGTLFTPTTPEVQYQQPTLYGTTGFGPEGVEFEDVTYVNEQGQILNFKRNKQTGQLFDLRGNPTVVPEGYTEQAKEEEKVETTPTTGTGVQTATVRDDGGREDDASPTGATTAFGGSLDSKGRVSGGFKADISFDGMGIGGIKGTMTDLAMSGLGQLTGQPSSFSLQPGQTATITNVQRIRPAGVYSGKPDTYSAQLQFDAETYNDLFTNKGVTSRKEMEAIMENIVSTYGEDFLDDPDNVVNVGLVKDTMDLREARQAQKDFVEAAQKADDTIRDEQGFTARDRAFGVRDETSSTGFTSGSVIDKAIKEAEADQDKEDKSGDQGDRSDSAPDRGMSDAGDTGFGSGTDCLTENMKVKLNGAIDFVTNIKVGDIIDGSVVKEVLHKHMRSGYYVINNELEITNDHPVLANGAWTKPEELYIGDYINDVKVKSIKYIDRMTPTVSIVIDGDSFDVYTEGNTYTVHGRYREVRQQAA